jgi:hypothetical protein
MTMIEKWNYRDVQDFDVLSQLWKSFGQDGPDQCVSVGEILRTRLGLPIVDMDADASRFFKHHYSTGQRNSEIMMTELSVIRRQEGW